MSADGRYYGIDSWVAWRDRAPDNLWPTRRTAEYIQRQPAFNVSTYRDLATIVSFLNVMNKNDHLLFRGQGREALPSPTLARDVWETKRLPEPVRLVDRRGMYFETLEEMRKSVVELLRGKLPRHRPFEHSADPARPDLRVAPWAVIQHYELWPTPLLDLTGSLRVAASFAFGVPPCRTTGFLYVFSAPRVVSDLMPRRPRTRRTTVRLSAVCPPITQRPHLQDGYLIGDPQTSTETLNESAGLLWDCLVAVFRLHDNEAGGGRGFWDDDFPSHTKQSLLPTAATDDLAAAFDAAFTFRLQGGIAVVEHN